MPAATKAYEANRYGARGLYPSYEAAILAEARAGLSAQLGSEAVTIDKLLDPVKGPRIYEVMAHAFGPRVAAQEDTAHGIS